MKRSDIWNKQDVPNFWLTFFVRVAEFSKLTVLRAKRVEYHIKMVLLVIKNNF